MNPDDVRAFVRRDWALIERLKEEQRIRRYREQGPNATLDMAASLHEHARAVSPDFPSERTRREDLEHHVRLKQLLDRAGHALAVR